NAITRPLACGGGCSDVGPVGQRGSASPVFLELESAGSAQQAAVAAAVGRPFRLVRRRPIQFATPRRRFLQSAAPSATTAKSTHATRAKRKLPCAAAEKNGGERRTDPTYDFHPRHARRHD